MVMREVVRQVSFSTKLGSASISFIVGRAFDFARMLRRANAGWHPHLSHCTAKVLDAEERK